MKIECNFEGLILKPPKMKNLSVLIVIIAMASFTACKQTEKNVPLEVRTTFSEKFPEAAKVKWDKENATEWEAEFNLNGVEYSANFDESGTWLETEYKISSEELPEAVIATLDIEFGDYSVDLAEVSETQMGKVFELTLKNGKEEMEISTDMDGKVLQKSQVQQEEEAEEEGEEDDID
jgi:flagellar motor switch/type III secretory pathway protein FliN